jgi:hypothetical protein
VDDDSDDDADGDGDITLAIAEHRQAPTTLSNGTGKGGAAAAKTKAKGAAKGTKVKRKRANVRRNIKKVKAGTDLNASTKLALQAEQERKARRANLQNAAPPPPEMLPSLDMFTGASGPDDDSGGGAAVQLPAGGGTHDASDFGDDDGVSATSPAFMEHEDLGEIEIVELISSGDEAEVSASVVPGNVTGQGVTAHQIQPSGGATVTSAVVIDDSSDDETGDGQGASVSLLKPKTKKVKRSRKMAAGGGVMLGKQPTFTDDAANTRDKEGNVLVNILRSADEPSALLIPELAAVVKPHQIGGIRFMWENVVETDEQFKTTEGYAPLLFFILLRNHLCF